MKKEKVIERIVKDLVFGVDLDKEVSEQAGLYFYYAMKWVEASKKVLIAKAELEYVEAKLRRKFREELSTNGKKVTEGLLEELVKSDEEYRRVLNEYIQAKEEESFWQIVKEAMKQKKDMIEAWINANMVMRWMGEQIKVDEIELIRNKLREKLRGKMIKVDNEIKDNKEG